MISLSLSCNLIRRPYKLISQILLPIPRPYNKLTSFPLLPSTSSSSSRIIQQPKSMCFNQCCRHFRPPRNTIEKSTTVSSFAIHNNSNADYHPSCSPFPSSPSSLLPHWRFNLINHTTEASPLSLSSSFSNFNHQNLRWFSTEGPPPIEAKKSAQQSDVAEIPPNVSTEISNEPKQQQQEERLFSSEHSEELNRTEEKNKEEEQIRGEEQNRTEEQNTIEEPVKANDAVSRPSKRSALRQATRFVFAAVPGQAHVVMQQQNLIARILTSRLRLWQTPIIPRSQKPEQQQPEQLVDSAQPSTTLGRRSRSRKRRREFKATDATTLSAKAQRRENGSRTEEEAAIRKEEETQQQQQHRAEHHPEPFLKESTIEEKPMEEEQNYAIPRSVSTLMTDQQLDALPKDLQPSLEVSLGSEPTKVLDAATADFPIQTDIAIPSSLSSASMQTDIKDSQQELDRSLLDRSEILRNYESVLQVVLAPGVIESDAKRFLGDYRKRFNIKITQHSEALTRLGWNDVEYDQGFSSVASAKVPQWRRVLNRYLDVCESGGNYIVTVGSLASLTSIMMANMAHLRMLQLVSGTFYLLYNVTRRPPLTSSAYWNLVFFAINSIMLLKLFLETRPEAFTEDELDVFERHFLETGLTPRRFKNLLKGAHWRVASKGEVLIRQGEEVKELMVVHQGSLSILLNASEVERLEGGDKNAIIGLKTFLTRLDNERRIGQSKPAAGVLPATVSDGALARRKAVEIESSLTDQINSASQINASQIGLTAANNAAVGNSSNTNSDDDLVKVADNEQSLVSVPSHTTVVVVKDSRLLVWPMDELVKRVVADPVNLGFPLVGGMAKSLVARSRNQALKQTLTSYEAAITGVLADGICGVEEKHFLQECRQKFNVSEDQHWEVVGQLGWTKEEFESGAKGTAPTIKTILQKVRGQFTSGFSGRGFSTETQAQHQQPSESHDSTVKGQISTTGFGRSSTEQQHPQQQQQQPQQQPQQQQSEFGDRPSEQQSHQQEQQQEQQPSVSQDSAVRDTTSDGEKKHWQPSVGQASVGKDLRSKSESKLQPGALQDLTIGNRSKWKMQARRSAADNDESDVKMRSDKSEEGKM